MVGVGRAVRRALAAAAACAVAACGGRRAPAASDAPPGPAPLSAEAVRAHVALLASDALQGRQTPSAGLDLAAEYVAAALRRAGLRGAGDGGGFVQRFPFPLVAPDSAGARLTVGAGDARRVLRYGVDYVVLPGGGARAATGGARLAGALPALLAGRALDSLGADGVVAVRLPGFPSRDARRLAELARTRAEAGGARAIVFAIDSTVPAVVMAHAARTAAEPVREPAEAADGIPAAFVRDAATVAALARGEAVRVELAAPRRLVRGDRAPNVVAVLAGRDPRLRDEHVVVSAHMDHVGTAPGLADSVFNGADDNASGTAALVEIARALAALPAAQRPRRSVLFVAVGGEEHGLLGSRWLVAHPPVPLGGMVANVNLDMIGRGAGGRVIGVGQEYSTVGGLARELAGVAGAPALVPDPAPEEGHFRRSDQFSFVRAGVPALFLTTGPHADYHKTSDEAARLDAETAARVGRLARDLVRRLADAPERPRWTAAGRAMLDSLR